MIRWVMEINNYNREVGMECTRGIDGPDITDISDLWTMAMYPYEHFIMLF